MKYMEAVQNCPKRVRLDTGIRESELLDAPAQPLWKLVDQRDIPLSGFRLQQPGRSILFSGIQACLHVEGVEFMQPTSCFILEMQADLCPQALPHSWVEQTEPNLELDLFPSALLPTRSLDHVAHVTFKLSYFDGSGPAKHILIEHNTVDAFEQLFITDLSTCLLISPEPASRTSIVDEEK